MRISLIKKLNVLALYLLYTNTMSAAPEPPAPTPPPPGIQLPVDHNLVFLLLTAIAYATFIIYKKQCIKKAST